MMTLLITSFYSTDNLNKKPFLKLYSKEEEEEINASHIGVKKNRIIRIKDALNYTATFKLDYQILFLLFKQTHSSFPTPLSYLNCQIISCFFLLCFSTKQKKELNCNV